LDLESACVELRRVRPAFAGSFDGRNPPSQKLLWRARQKKGQTEHRTAQPPTLAIFRSWGSSAGAGRAGLPGGKDRKKVQSAK